MQSAEVRDLEIDGQQKIYAVFFSEDGEELLSSGSEGLVRKWDVDDGHEVGDAFSADSAAIWAAALSPDCSWLVCGLNAPPYVIIWNAETQEKVLDVEGHRRTVFSIDVSPDSTKFATGGSDMRACIWSLSTLSMGRRLVGPLHHDGYVVAVRFSPSGDRLATADSRSIRIYRSDNGRHLLNIPCRFDVSLSSPLDWSADSRRLFAASLSEARSFDASSGTLQSKWSIPGDGAASIVLSHNQRFIAIAAAQSLSFWDASTHERIGPVFECQSNVYSIALSPNDERIVTGEENGKLTLRSLPISIRFLPSHLLELPLIEIGDATLNLWMQGDLNRVGQLLTEEILHPSNSFRRAYAYAHRALLHSCSKRYIMAIDDAKKVAVSGYLLRHPFLLLTIKFKSIEVHRSAIGHVALAMARVGNGEHDSAIRVFDLVFTDGLSKDNNFLLLIKAVLLFQCGKHDDAISRIGDLIDIADDKLERTYITVRAQLLFLLGGLSLCKRDYKRAVELLTRAQRAAVPFQKSRQLISLSLIFGWDFDGLVPAIRRHLDDCIKPLEDRGDAMQSSNLEEANELYSIALSLNPPNPASILVKRSEVRAILSLWEDALSDANEAIKADPQNPWAYERKHVALHSLHRFDQAVDAINHLHSLIRESLNQDIRELRDKYVSPTRLTTAIDNAVHDVFKICPLVLIDVKSGYLCDVTQRIDIFKSESQFNELISSMSLGLDDDHILRVAGKYFQYVTLSHVWEGKEPSYQDVRSVNSIWSLESTPANKKLRRFCEVVRGDGYRWAWSDTCCIDKTISTVLHQSLKMMYKWYEASASTFVFLADVDSVLPVHSLKDSKWMTRAWTSQELLVSKVIRFYDCNWKPYLGDTRQNHKESPGIMQELTNAIGLTRETITAFNPDNLSVREKLRLASTRHATLEEDIAYSLIGIFKSDIRPDYGEGEAALGHLLEEVVARSGEVMVLAWAGRSSSYNSCLPTTLAVYKETPKVSTVVEDSEMDVHVSALRDSLPQADVMTLYGQIIQLPPARFSHRRLYLPSIIFTVRRLGVQGFMRTQEKHYRARVPGIGYVDFYASETLSTTEPRKLILVHPWIRDVCDPFDGFTWGTISDDESDFSDVEAESRPGSVPPPPTHTELTPVMDDYTRAMRFLVRLQHPFHVLLLQKQPNGEFRRVASGHEIVVPGLDNQVNFGRDIRTGVVEIL